MDYYSQEIKDKVSKEMSQSQYILVKHGDKICRKKTNAKKTGRPLSENYASCVNGCKRRFKLTIFYRERYFPFCRRCALKDKGVDKK